MKFTWDPTKATQNNLSHRVALAEALSVFGDPLARIHADPDHSEDERREIIIGRSRTGRLCWYAFPESADSVRLFSAREVSAHERRKYEEQ
ncbi:MAG: BrnT family toxin [Acidobacteriota bacterium]